MRYVFAVLFVASVFKLSAQQPVIRPDTSRLSIPVTDTISKNSDSNSGLNSEVKYTADDSIKFSIDRNTVYLYGNGRVTYEDFELSADYIRLDQKNKTLFARGLKDKHGRYRGRPIFKQGAEGAISTDSLVFNFESKKGKSYGSFSEVDGGYISAQQSKKNPYNEISFKNGIYSTCNLPHPHFGIHISKGIVTEKQVISGPAYLVIEDIPFPAILPFGFFPKTNKRASGFRFPSFGEDATLGFFMRDAGWYLGINDYWDAEMLGTLYSKGSYQTSVAARYKKNYKYSGALNLRFASTRIGVEGTDEYKPTKNFNVTWNHTQNTEANPGTNFSANVNFGTSSYYRDTRAQSTYALDQLTQNNISSGINYSKTFGIFSFSSSLRHEQDLTNKLVSLDLPTFTFNMNSINPFENKNSTGNPKWYEKLNVSYAMTGSNSLPSIHESNVFKKTTVDSLRNGVTHAIPISIPFNVLKVFQFSTGISYNERWSFQTISRQYTDTSQTTYETTKQQGFRRNFDYSLNTSLTTKLFGQLNFKKGNMVAIRHVFTPNFGFSYRPDFSSDKYGYYKYIETSDSSALKDNSVSRRYSIFEGTLVGGPGAGRSAALSFNFDNTIEAKMRSKSDTSSAYTKVPIIQGLTFSGNYDFAREEFDKLSIISVSGRTAFFKQKLGINFFGTLDPYKLDSNGNRDSYLIKNGGFLRLATFGFSTSFNFNSGQLQKRQESLSKQQDNPNLSNQQQQDISYMLKNPNAFVDFSVPWSISGSYSFNYNNNGIGVSTIINTLNFSGDLSVTPKWKVGYTSGWDFEQNEVSQTSFSIYRDLHCWDLSFNWIPFGPYKSYSVDLRVRASILQDLKLSRRHSSYSGYSF